MLLTLILSLVMMLGLFLMLWSAVGLIQNAKLFTSAPKQVRDVLQPKQERFRGQRAFGRKLMVISFVLMGGALFVAAYDGIRNGFTFWQFAVRFIMMLLLLKAFDILFFDYYLLCRSNFFLHYYPETKEVLGKHLFGYNKKSHLIQGLLCIAGSLIAAFICTLF